MNRKRRPKAPSHKEIFLAQKDIWLQCPNAIGDAYEYCWGCGFCASEDDWQTKAHIIAHEDDGSNDPTNYLLLCDVCHKEQPSKLPREAQIEWLKHVPHWRPVFEAKYGESLNRLTQMLAEQNVLFPEFYEWFENSGVKERAYAGSHSSRADLNALISLSMQHWSTPR